MCVCVAVLEHCKAVSGRIQMLLDARQELTDDEMDKFGKKDAEAYPHTWTGVIVYIYIESYMYLTV